jgi:hypothetical protein
MKTSRETLTRSGIRNPLAGLLFLLAALFLAGCLGGKDDGRVAGGDDIPNDVEPLGKKSARTRDDSADWNGFRSMPRTSPGMYDTTTVPDSIPDTTGAGQAQPKTSSHALAKRSGDVPGIEDTLASNGDIPPLADPLKPLDTLVTKVVDTAKGVIEAVHTTVKDSIVKIDSTVFVPVDSSNPGAPRGVMQVAGKITYADTGLWKAYTFRDADGDGFLAPRPGSLNLADQDVAVKLSTGIVRRTVQRVAAGADLDFNLRGDNRLLASSTVSVLGLDTLNVIRLLDADGDSIVLDLSRDTNLVDLVEEHRYPGDALLVSKSLKVRLVVYSKDSTKNYAVRFEQRTVLKDGGIVTLVAKGSAADSTFRAGTEAFWTEISSRPASDSLVARQRAYQVRLSPTPGAFEGNVLLGLAVEEVFRNASYDRFTFDFRPEQPVADRRWPATGAIKSSLAYRAGATLTFEGQAVAGGMEGGIEWSTGAALSIFFDRNGIATRRP